MTKFICQVLLEYASNVEAETSAEALKALKYQLSKQPYKWKLLSIEKEGLTADHKCEECEADKARIHGPPAPPSPKYPGGGKPSPSGGTPTAMAVAA